MKRLDADTDATIARYADMSHLRLAVPYETSKPSIPPRDDVASDVHAAQQGDEAAFERLYTAVQPGLLRYLRALVANDAEDVASEAWLQIARDLPGLRDAAGFRGWAATIARHRAMDHLRRQRRRPATVAAPIEDLPDLPNGQPDPCEETVTSISTDAAVALIASLPRDQAEAVLLRAVVGLDAESAARVLGKRAGAVRVAAHRGLRRLAAQLNRQRPDQQHLNEQRPDPQHLNQQRPDHPVEKSQRSRVTRNQLRAPE